jgi:hypothetical protein
LTKALRYKDCSLCRGSGVVTDILEEDFILSLNEDTWKLTMIGNKKLIIMKDKAYILDFNHYQSKTFCGGVYNVSSFKQ